jgi:hypothetical protein
MRDFIVSLVYVALLSGLSDARSSMWRHDLLVDVILSYCRKADIILASLSLKRTSTTSLSPLISLRYPSSWLALVTSSFLLGVWLLSYVVIVYFLVASPSTFSVEWRHLTYSRLVHFVWLAREVRHQMSSCWPQLRYRLSNRSKWRRLTSLACFGDVMGGALDRWLRHPFVLVDQLFGLELFHTLLLVSLSDVHLFFRLPVWRHNLQSDVILSFWGASGVTSCFFSLLNRWLKTSEESLFHK